MTKAADFTKEKAFKQKQKTYVSFFFFCKYVCFEFATNGLPLKFLKLNLHKSGKC
jgi:hypothetical protein